MPRDPLERLDELERRTERTIWWLKLALLLALASLFSYLVRW